MKTTINKKNPGRILGYLMAVAMVLFANVFAFSQTSAPYCETFDSGAPGWTNNGWVNDQYGTPSGNTGPTDDITGGGFYMYYETSGTPAPVIDITSDSIDISGLATPTLSFYNHMYGATIGTLDIYVNGTLEWTMSGDQGNQWNWAQVDLSSYAGSNVSFKFEAYYGGGFTGDIAIDQVCVDEYIVINGCTDPFALNYDASANTDDGSCTYCQGTYLCDVLAGPRSLVAFPDRYPPLPSRTRLGEQECRRGASLANLCGVGRLRDRESGGLPTLPVQAAEDLGRPFLETLPRAEGPPGGL